MKWRISAPYTWPAIKRGDPRRPGRLMNRCSRHDWSINRLKSVAVATGFSVVPLKGRTNFLFFSLTHFLNRTRPPPTGSIDWGVVVVGPLNDSNMLLKERGRRWKVAPRRATESFRISVSLMSLPVRSDSCANRPISFRPVPDAADQSFIRDSLRARFTFLFDYLSTVPDNILIDSNKKKCVVFEFWYCTNSI